MAYPVRACVKMACLVPSSSCVCVASLVQLVSLYVLPLVRSIMLTTLLRCAVLVHLAPNHALPSCCCIILHICLSVFCHGLQHVLFRCFVLFSPHVLRSAARCPVLSSSLPYFWTPNPDYLVVSSTAYHHPRENDIWSPRRTDWVNALHTSLRGRIRANIVPPSS